MNNDDDDFQISTPTSVPWQIYYVTERERLRYKSVLEEIVAFSNSHICVEKARDALEWGDALRAKP